MGNTELWQQLQKRATKDLATEELNVERFISICDTDHTIWQVAAEHGNIGLLERVWEWGKKGPQVSKITFCLPSARIGNLPQGLSKMWIIRNIEHFCSTTAAFGRLSSRIMPYVTTWAADWQFTCYSELSKGYWSKGNVGFWMLFWLHVTPSLAQWQTPWLNSLCWTVGLWGKLLVFVHLQEKDMVHC